MNVEFTGWLVNVLAYIDLKLVSAVSTAVDLFFNSNVVIIIIVIVVKRSRVGLFVIEIQRVLCFRLVKSKMVTLLFSAKSWFKSLVSVKKKKRKKEEEKLHKSKRKKEV